MQQYYRNIISEIGEDPNRNGLIDTPKRAENAFRLLTKGYQQSLSDVVNGALFDSSYDQMVLLKDIEFNSTCEHHLLPFIGVCHIAYIPSGKVLGLSKVARIVDMYSHRLQIQERLSSEIANAILTVTDAKGVAVIMDATHTCMTIRGIKKQNSVTRTFFTLGEFKQSSVMRNEFLSSIKGGR